MIIRPVAVFLFCFSLPVLAEPIASLPFSQFDPSSPVGGTLHVDAIQLGESRISVEVRADAPRLLEVLDGTARARGNLGDCTTRFFWLGPTQFRSARGAAVTLASRGRGELWTCGWIKTRLLEDTRGFDIRLTPFWVSGATHLDLNVELVNIRGFPDDLERILRDLGLDFSSVVQIPLGNPDTLAALAPELSALAFSGTPGSPGVSLSARLELDREETLRELFQGIDDVQLGRAILTRLFGL